MKTQYKGGKITKKREDFYWFAVKIIAWMPYPVRLFFWKNLYWYNKRKYPWGKFTLEEYIKYAQK